MSWSQLTPTRLQKDVLQNPINESIFLEGIAGVGKTFCGVLRLQDLLLKGYPGSSILVLLPQRTLANPYLSYLSSVDNPAGSIVSVLTLSGLAKRMIDLFWPIVSEIAGFDRLDEPPTFLNLETAQYFMAHVVEPLYDEGLFNSVTISRNRLYSQILDNLNKAALVGFSLHDIGERLKSAWIGDPSQLNVYDDVQTSANHFREYCLANNLLDFSLQFDVFIKHLWPSALCQETLQSTYRHLIWDNLEEDTPCAHDLMLGWLPYFDSALFIYDWDAGFRRFLGADPKTGYQIKNQCCQSYVLDETIVMAPEVQALAGSLATVLQRSDSSEVNKDQLGPRSSSLIEKSSPLADQNFSPGEALVYEVDHRFYPQMLDWVAEQIAGLVLDQRIPAGEIVVLAPYFSDALRFALQDRLDEYGIPYKSHRPSRALREEPVSQCLICLAALVYLDWEYLPTQFDLVNAFVQAIEGMDRVRAQLLANIVYKVRVSPVELTGFEIIKPDVQERITYRLGERYEGLRTWIGNARDTTEPLDIFLGRLFGELLSQPGFGFHSNFDAGITTANLIESFRNFRHTVGGVLGREGVRIDVEYINMVQNGVISAQYLFAWQKQSQDAVLLAPATTFLMSNRPVTVQFWLDIGNLSWSRRLFQPLTHPYVLNRSWNLGDKWSDKEEVEAENLALYNLVLGLVRRCRKKIYLGLSELNEQGYEQRSPLQRALQRVLRDMRDKENGAWEIIQP